VSEIQFGLLLTLSLLVAVVSFETNFAHKNFENIFVLSNLLVESLLSNLLVSHFQYLKIILRITFSWFGLAPHARATS
jgi:hypothetical protein